VEIFPEERYPLEEGAFWVDDLIGMTVVDHSTGDVLGTVSEVFPAGENDLYVVRDEAGTDHFIPAVREFIAGVDLDRREMRISLIEGLWES
jgi:RimM protein, required for 16S rRNA processing